jgi:hypothetical protein
MGLRFPPATTISKFTGGFKPTSSYSDLSPTETNDSENVDYGPNGDIAQRAGSLKLYNVSLKTTDGTAGRPITGHYHFSKLGSDSFDVVMAGDSIFNYNTSTASVIASTLTDNSATLWDVAQIQDPRSASDDVIIMTNGVDPIKLWNGSATAINISALTSATQVPICKFLLQYKSIVYAANIVDSTNVDSPVQVYRTEIGTDGAPNPHRFTQNFFVGGSDSDGELQGQELLNEQIIYYTKQSIWRFIPGIGDTNDLEKINNNIGLLAPRSLVTTGNLHIFLSERGVYTFDGSIVTHISDKVDDIIYEKSNKSILNQAVAEYDYRTNQYILYFAGDVSSRKNLCLRFDVRLLHWQPLTTTREVNYVSNYVNSSGLTRVVYGDYMGYLYEDGVGKNDGITNGHNGYVSTATLSVVTVTASLPTTNDGLQGLLFQLISGTGEGNKKRIVANTSSTVTLESELPVVPDTTSRYTIGAIPSYWRGPDLAFGHSDIVKIFRSILVRLAEQGNQYLYMHYIVNFSKLRRATLKSILMYKDAWVWGLSRWGIDSWGKRLSFQKKISCRNTNTQKINGTHLAVRFSNNRANEEWKVQGFDVETQQIGKR